MRRLLALVTLALAALLFAGCSQEMGTVGYIGGQRVSEAEVDRAAAGFAPYGFDRNDVTQFVVMAKAAQVILAQKGLTPDVSQRAAAEAVPEIALLLRDPATRDVALGVIDFGSLENQLQPHGLALAVADNVRLDPRYGQFAAAPNAQGQLVYQLTGLSGATTGGLSVPATR